MAGRELGAVTVPIGAAYWSLLPERLGLWLLRRAPQHLGLYLHPQELGPDPQRIGMPAQAGPRRHAQATCAGECEVFDDDVGGIAVPIAYRIAARAGGGQVLVSRTVKDLVVGSHLRFTDAGEHTLKGVPEPWRLYYLHR